MKTLFKKGLRDLQTLQGQVLTIALVVASGIAGYVSMASTYRSLLESRDAYYASTHFADAFAQVQRAPSWLLAKAQNLPGVLVAEGRVVVETRLEVPSFPEVVRARFVSWNETSSLNRLTLLQGRVPWSNDEVVINEMFATAHHLPLGSRLIAYFNGRKTSLRVVGFGTSPEYVTLVTDMTQMGDHLRFGVVWMKPTLLASAFRLNGAFNDFTLAKSPQASEAALLSSLEQLLNPYGLFFVRGRLRQASNQLVDQELQQLKTSALLAPLIFLGVAGFLIHVLLSRIVEAQREQLATLKALGYAQTPLALHYVFFASVVVVLGSVGGAVLGVYGGEQFIELYRKYFHFPTLHFELDVFSLATAIFLSATTALLGALGAVRRTLKLAPAEAMRPDAPGEFRPTFLESLRIHRFLSILPRMVLRDLERHPIRSLLSALGVALSTAILVLGNMGIDAIEYIFALQFERAQHEDVTVIFSEPLSKEAALTFTRLPGVMTYELRRSIPVRLRRQHITRETILMALPENENLQTLLDVSGQIKTPPLAGLMLSRTLAKILHVNLGDEVEVEFLENKRLVRFLPMMDTLEDAMGLQAYMRADPLEKTLQQPLFVTSLLLKVERPELDRLLKRLTPFPKVLGVSRRDVTQEKLRATLAESFVTLQFILISIAVAIAVGVVYNNARIALAQRSRDLATLRILGFQRSEIAWLLLGEQMVQLFLGIPLGLPLGKLMGAGLFSLTAEELFRFPVVVSPRTWATAACVVWVAGFVSGWLVSVKAKRLNLVSVLKARD